MGTTQTGRNTEKIDCQVCGHRYTIECDYRQGRCPHHPAMLTTIKTRFTNLINFFKGN